MFQYECKPITHSWPILYTWLSRQGRGMSLHIQARGDMRAMQTCTGGLNDCLCIETRLCNDVKHSEWCVYQCLLKKWVKCYTMMQMMLNQWWCWKDDRWWWQTDDSIKGQWNVLTALSNMYVLDVKDRKKSRLYSRQKTESRLVGVITLKTQIKQAESLQDKTTYKAMK